MAKRTAQELREQAKKLIEQAEKIENERAIKIGNLIIKYEAADFEGFDLEAFKKQIASI
ncbi:MAG: hypothetical protein ACOYU2_06090 [Nitrospirota bacterium]